MKKTILGLLSSLLITTASVFAHGEIKLGPNGGRLLELSKNEGVHGEVTLKDGKFHIALVDKDKNAVKIGEQTLTANGGPSGKAAKLEVTKEGDSFVVPAVKPSEWLILQFKETPKAKAVTARMLYDTGNCGACSSPEWICKCNEQKKKK